MNSRWRRHRMRQHEVPEMNITAFMNLMVILVPFLLITAVFSRVAVLDLNLPSPSSEPTESQDEPKQQITVTVRASGLTLGDREGAIREIPSVGGSYNLPALTDLLIRIKDRIPDETSAVVLLEPDIPYDTLIQVMDAVRVATPEQTGDTRDRELFPAIALGDAPAVKGDTP